MAIVFVRPKREVDQDHSFLLATNIYNNSMLKCSYPVCFFVLLCLTSCQVRLQKASEPWGEAKPQAKVADKNWGNDTGDQIAQASAIPSSKPVVIKSPTPNSNPAMPNNWQIQPPDLSPEAKLSADSIVGLAQTFLGTPYRFGGESPSEGFDCSGLVHYVYGLKGISMKRLANEQFLQGTPIAQAHLQPGDLVFFSTSGKIVDHVGIYAGNRLFIHAPRTGRTVSYDSLDATWYSSRFQGARRIQ